MCRNNKVIVTGGAGLIGSYISDHLIKTGCDVTVVDNLYRGRKEYLSNEKSVTFIEKDIRELTSGDAIEGVTQVIHTASKVLGIGYSASNQVEMMTHNDDITNALLSYLDHFPDLKELVIISSSCVYDDNVTDCSDDSPLTGTPELANVGYGLAKRFLEDKCRLYAKERGLKLVVVRPFNIYGERYTWAGKNSQGLPSLVKKLLDNNGKLEIWGTGSQRRNYMHASDCARIICELPKLQTTDSGTYNVGLKETISLKELAERMCKLYGLEPEFVYLHDMPQGRLNKICDETSLRTLYPDYDDGLVSLDEGLLSMRQWYFKTFSRN
ncbi:NAD(P)-dependent oxidoreductase [Vibrio sp. La 4.2.2]|uniref:NAD-dependent epimerase/dehydratase family protein n=1 Tax=Vibrio sp. La 4.2.2 TaxID=2998830 RepID=UPI0022CE3573|nr:NAD(P)-dependent oxidoreductase [Vibrio sp. La 4.2.2]MDA0110527.1 NAD(P)-dependent oxidoreductase [Vibrio sp. La 4.2.2]